MVNIIKEDLDIEEALKKKLEFICSFCNTRYEIKKEIMNQQTKRERIKQAYINGSFTLEEHDKEVKYVDDTIAQLERDDFER